MHQNIDFIIVGGGLAGCVLALELLNHDARVLLVDRALAGAASPIAAGIGNPVSGRRLVLEPEFDDKRVALETFISPLEQLSGRKLLTELPQIRYLNKDQRRELPKLRTLPEFKRFASGNSVPDESQENSLTISNTIRLDVQATCELAQKLLDSKNSRIATRFDYDELVVGNTHVQWREFKAKKIIFCEGWRGIHNPWFNALPFNLNKGQLLKLHQSNTTPGLLNWGQWELQTDTGRWLGATTERDYQHLNPDRKGHEILFEGLSAARKQYPQNLPRVQEAQIIQQYAGIRPATIDRKPFIGLHPVYQRLGIFNGFGGKGALHIPQAALTFVDQLLLSQDSPNQARLDRLLLNYYN